MSAGGEIIEGLVKVVFRQGAKRIGKMVTGAIGKKLSKDEAKEALEKIAEQKLAKATRKAKEKVKRIAEHYADAVNSNRPWKWRNIPGGEKLTAGQKVAVKREAIERGLIPNVPMKIGTKYPDFEKSGLIKKVDELPEKYWQASDKVQFKYLDSRIPGGRPSGYTWHHSEVHGRMELVPFGPHNIINHLGGRSTGGWCYRRQGR